MNFRPSWINSTAAAVGWDLQYLAGPEDMEAERLFDYGLLAPINTGDHAVEMAVCSNSSTMLTGISLASLAALQARSVVL